MNTRKDPNSTMTNMKHTPTQPVIALDPNSINSSAGNSSGRRALDRQEERAVARVAVRNALIGKAEDGKCLSATTQLEAGERYCLSKEFELDLAASLAHQDEGQASQGKSCRERPGIAAHYEAAQRGEFQHLIFFNLRRIGRNVDDVLDLIDAFEAVGVSVHTVAENINYSSSIGRFMRSVLFAAAELQAQ